MQTIPYLDEGQATDAIKNIERGKRLCFSNMPNDVYHKLLGLSSTRLKNASYSARKYHHPLTKEPSPALQFGTIVHDVLERAIKTDVAVSDLLKTDEEFGYAAATTNLGKAQRRMQAGGKLKDVIHIYTSIAENKEARAKGLIVIKEEDFDEAAKALKHRDYTLVTKADFQVIEGFYDIVLKHDVLNEFLKRDVKKEHSIFYRDADSDLILKCRPDVWVGKEMVDWKSSRSVVTSPRWFGSTIEARTDNATRCSQRIIESYGYDFSAAHYLNVADAEEFTVVLLDKENLDIFVVALGEEYLRRARIRVDHAIKTVQQTDKKSLYLPSDAVLFIEHDEEIVV